MNIKLLGRVIEKQKKLRHTQNSLIENGHFSTIIFKIVLFCVKEFSLI